MNSLDALMMRKMFMTKWIHPRQQDGIGEYMHQGWHPADGIVSLYVMDL